MQLCFHHDGVALLDSTAGKSLENITKNLKVELFDGLQIQCLGNNLKFVHFFNDDNEKDNDNDNDDDDDCGQGEVGFECETRLQATKT